MKSIPVGMHHARSSEVARLFEGSDATRFQKRRTGALQKVIATVRQLKRRRLRHVVSKGPETSTRQTSIVLVLRCARSVRQGRPPATSARSLLRLEVPDRWLPQVIVRGVQRHANEEVQSFIELRLGPFRGDPRRVARPRRLTDVSGEPMIDKDLCRSVREETPDVR